MFFPNVSASDVLLRLGPFQSDDPSTSPTAPSLKPLAQCPISFIFFLLILERPMLQCFQSLCCPQLLPVIGWWLQLPKCSLVHTLWSSHRHEYLFCDLQSCGLPDCPVRYPLHPFFMCCLVPRSFIPLLHSGRIRSLLEPPSFRSSPCSTIPA